MSVNEKMTAIAAAIRAKTGKGNLLTLDQMAAEIYGIQASGNNALDYANALPQLSFTSPSETSVDLIVSFGGKSEAAINTDAVKAAFQNAYGYRSIKINWQGRAYSGGLSLFNSFRCNETDWDLQTIDLTGLQNPLKVTTMNRTFEYRRGLREILGEFDLTNCTVLGSFITQGQSLETIRFTPGTIKISMSLFHSPLLTAESIQSIIDGLADLTGGTAQTLTLHADVGAKLTDAQKAAASAKNWTLTY